MISLTLHPATLTAMYLSTDTVSLTESQLDRAFALAEDLPTEAQQWQAYVNALARSGVEQWLRSRAPELSVHPAATDDPQHLQVGNFRLYLIATDDLEAIEIPLPPAAIVPDFVPHIYVWVEVIEELGQVQIRSAAAQAQIAEHVRSTPPSAGVYWLKAQWFDASPDRLLLWLRCLDVAALPTAAVAAARLTADPIPSPLAQGAMNLAVWLSDRLDQLAQELSWVLLPPPAPSLEFRPLRSPAEELNQVLAELVQQNRIAAPPRTHGGYRDFQWEDAALRLYAVTWKTSETDWALLLILGAQPGSALPLGTRLQVRDDREILAEPVLRDRAQEYLFTQVIGTGAECFWVSIALGSGTVLTLPPFTFAADASLT